MTPKRQRLLFVLVGLAMVATGVGIILSIFKDNLVFFYTPSEVTQHIRQAEARARIGGLVKAGSVETSESGALLFIITDYTAEIAVTYRGLVPSLFREGQGVVAEGHFTANGIFTADSILAKHDENYKPPKVKEALEKSGKWKETPLPQGLTSEPPAL